VAGIIGIAVILGSYLAYLAIHPYHWALDPVDLGVYRSGGLIVRHVRPWYDPHLASPLYDWPGYTNLHLKFTYPPFAAVVFAVVSLIPWRVLPPLSVAVNIAALLAALWFTFGGLGYRRGLTRLGATVLTAAAVFWTEPVIRTLYLGQVNLVLMALIIWDLCQPDTRRSGASRWWKGAGVGVAAGIKLVPLIFIPYLLATRRFRAAAVACVAFAATVATGFVVAPADSARWWLHGLFLNGGRTGFVGWEGNQSLRALLTRLAGSVAGAGPVWLAVALVTAVAGLACAALLDRAGHQMPGLLACALTGLLISPISWDHHWVWVVPGVAVAAAYAVRAMRAPDGPLRPAARPAGLDWRRAARWPAAGYWALAGAMLVVYGAWPGVLWGEPHDLGPFSLGVIWQPPSTNPEIYYRLGDRPWFAEYHWHGLELLTGNAFLLGGLALLAVLIAAALRPRTTTTTTTPASPGRRQPTGPSRPMDHTNHTHPPVIMGLLGQ
jgi:alpha-1,2-mannosyltransferase